MNVTDNYYDDDFFWNGSATIDDPYEVHFDVKWNIIQYVIPTFFAIGLVSNALGFMVFARRLRRLVTSGVPKRLEQCATCGLLFLAASDFLLCASGLPSAFTSIEPLARADDFADLCRLRYVMTKTAFLNVWVFTSTWITCLLCAQRCLGVCYPIRFSSVVNFRRTAIANISVFAISFLVNAPGFRRFTMFCIDEQENGYNCYIKPSSEFASRYFYVTYYVIWSILGGAPVIIMVFCNSKLMTVVRRKSRHAYSSVRDNTARSERRRNKANQTTFLLVLITTIYLGLVAPSLFSNIFVLLLQKSTETMYVGFQIVMVLLNLAQVINFSTSFFVCLAFSSTFRNHFVRIFRRPKPKSTARRTPPKPSPRDKTNSPVD